MRQKAGQLAASPVLWSSVVLVVLGFVLFAPMMQRWSLLSDYEVHNALAYDLTEDPAEVYRNTPHFVYHTLTALVYRLLPRTDIWGAGAWVMTLSYVALLLLIFWRLWAASAARGWWGSAALAGLALASLLVTPINLLSPENLYFGYFTSHVYHNPTVQMMKPFSVALFFAVPLLYRKGGAPGWRWLPVYLLLTALSLFSKPSFILAFVPALGLLTLGRLVLRKPIHWGLLLGGIVLPAVAILGLQTLTWTGGGGIGFDPLRVFYEWTLHYEEYADQFLLEKLLLSVAFPLTVYALHWRQACRHLLFNLGWLTFVVAAAQAYLLVDYSVIAAGDFGWSAQIGVFVLFLSALLFLVERYAPLFVRHGWTARQRALLALSLAVLLLHVISGLYWYHLHRIHDPLDLLYIWW